MEEPHLQQCRVFQRPRAQNAGGDFTGLDGKNCLLEAAFGWPEVKAPCLGKRLCLCSLQSQQLCVSLIVFDFVLSTAVQFFVSVRGRHHDTAMPC